MKILTVCPSLRRDKLALMLESFNATRSLTHKVVIDSESQNTTIAINKAFNENPDYDFYHITNDDVIYKTKDWDLKLTSKRGVNYGNDLVQGSNHCTFPMISGDIVRSLGWLQMPRIEFLYGDTVWMNIGSLTGCLNYDNDVIIEHNHVIRTGIADSVYQKTNSEEQYQRDGTGFAQWIVTEMACDVNKVKGVLSDTGKFVC